MTTAQDGAPNGAREPFAAIHARITGAASKRGAGAGRSGGSPGELGALAQKFEGLPKGVTHAKQLLEPLRELGNRLPFPRAALATLDMLVAMTPAAPWRKGDDREHPVVVVSNYELAARQGMAIRTIQFHIRWLAEAGAIARRPGPSGHRTRRRNADGTEDRFGIDLAPLVAFSQHMRAGAAEARAHRSTMKRLRASIRSIAIEAAKLRDGARDLADVTLEREIAGLGVPEAVREAVLAAVESGRAIEALSEEAFLLLSRDAASAPEDQPGHSERMHAIAGQAQTALEAMRGSVFAGLAALPSDAWGPADAAAVERGILPHVPVDAAPETTIDSPVGESGFTKTLTKGLCPPSGGYVPAKLVVRHSGDVRPDRNQSELDLGRQFDTAEAGTGGPPPLADVELAVDRLLELDPELPGLLQHVTGVASIAQARPQHVFDVARYIVCEEFQGSQRIWAEQCERKGPVVASLAALLTYIKPAEQLRNGSRLSYWLGICRKPRPEINLVPSIFAAHRRMRERERAEA